MAAYETSPEGIKELDTIARNQEYDIQGLNPRQKIMAERKFGQKAEAAEKNERIAAALAKRKAILEARKNN